jgi:prepilin-type N-terminal cleavage/methylation domain-containing protein
MSRTNANVTRRGFTLVELAVVIVIIGVLAAFGVPKFLASVERSKAAEAFNYLSAVRSAEERYIAKEGVYCKDTSSLDIVQAAPKYFDLPNTTGTGDITTEVGGGTDTTIAAGGSSWTMTLTRKSGTSSYGDYTVTFTQNGFDTANSSIITDSNTKIICPIGE